MGIIQSLVGTYSIEITSADIAKTLMDISRAGIHLLRITYRDELHICAEIYSYAIPTLKTCLQKNGCNMSVVERKGIFWDIYNLKKRPVILYGIILLAFLTLFIPTRIFFVRVEGNKAVPTQLIVEEAESCGVGFGTERRTIRSEKIKNTLLSVIPELEWAGVTTSGCVAVISVRERTVQNNTSPVSRYSSIVAARDGVITDVVVTKGNALCKVGDVVREGQMLVSGYTDCGLIIKASIPDAEITAQTQRNLCAVTPLDYYVKERKISQERKYKLRIGKNIINFFKYSGISDARCDKMYEEKFLVLPGGFQLPVSLITERVTYYQYDTVVNDQNDNMLWLEGASDLYLQRHMQAGTIIDSHRNADISDGVYYLRSIYSCNEMIGVFREEGFVSNDGKTD